VYLHGAGVRGAVVLKSVEQDGLQLGLGARST